MSTPAITVRPAMLADLPALAELMDQHRVLQGQASNLPAAQSFLQARFEQAESVLFIARAQAQAADSAQPACAALGFAQLYPSFSSTALARVFVLNDLFVHANGRRQGVATQLLAAVEQHAWACGAVRVTLNVARTNAAGQALYAAKGWQADQQFHMFHRFPPAR